jgi:uncharacterized protein
VVAEAVVAVAPEQHKPQDQFGIGWRGPLAAGILAHLNDLDCLEIIAEHYSHGSRATRQTLRYLSRQLPISLHGLSLGLAGSEPVPKRLLRQLRQTADALNPQSLSEHLAFVRAGGIELHHLAAPPRNPASLAWACEQIERAQDALKRPLALENIACLLQPPGSSLSETQWLSGIIQRSGCRLLLDLHNLYSNALNSGEAPETLLLQLPLDAVQLVHLSGGHWSNQSGLSRRLWIDDHRGDLPDALYELLSLLGQHCPQPLQVIIERDGNYPSMPALIGQLQRARAALALGRNQGPALSPAAVSGRHTPQALPPFKGPQPPLPCPTQWHLEWQLCQLLRLSDAELAEAVSRDPTLAQLEQRLDPSELHAMRQSLRHKLPPAQPPSWQRLRAGLKRLRAGLRGVP